jgi:hypothetical protein
MSERSGEPLWPPASDSTRRHPWGERGREGGDYHSIYMSRVSIPRQKSPAPLVTLLGFWGLVLGCRTQAWWWWVVGGGGGGGGGVGGGGGGGGSVATIFIEPAHRLSL